MTRDPQAIHIGLHVLTPNGPGVIRARRGGPIITWLVLDCWWPESWLTVPEPSEPQPRLRCDACRRAGASNHSLHCYGTGGVVIDGQGMPCGCRCGRGPTWNDELEPEVA